MKHHGRVPFITSETKQLDLWVTKADKANEWNPLYKSNHKSKLKK